MSDDRTVPPALDADNWARLARGGPTRSYQTATDFVVFTHAQMAVANASLPDGDPRKITGSDVWLVGFALRKLRDHAAELDPMLSREYEDGLAGLEQTVAKLAALLPPDELTIAT